jgi:hypothetical protein
MARASIDAPAEAAQIAICSTSPRLELPAEHVRVPAHREGNLPSLI